MATDSRSDASDTLDIRDRMSSQRRDRFSQGTPVTVRSWSVKLFLLLSLALQVGLVGSGWAQGSPFGPPFIISGGFTLPAGLGVDAANARVLIADAGSHRVKYATIPDLAGTPTWDDFGFVSGLVQPQALVAPQAVAADSAGNVYAVDTVGSQVQLYRWDASSGTYALDPDFGAATPISVNGVTVSFPRDIAVGADGRVYLLDSGNQRVLVADGPDDDAWALWRENSAWGNPYGLDVAADGSVYIADTQHHQILRVPPTGPEESIGQYGTGNGQFRYPRDVAVAADGRLFVADTFNHRVIVLNPDGSHNLTLGAAPLFGSPQKIEVDTEDRVFVVDSDYMQLVAYLGPVDEPPFDAYLRDYVGDEGAEPTLSDILLSSPDILIRHKPDVNVAVAESIGLEAFAFQQPRFEENNYVYLAVRNRGSGAIVAPTASLYRADPGTSLDFPAEWLTEGFYRSYQSEAANQPGNSLFVPFIGPRPPGGGADGDGVSVVGPLVWRPPEPESVIAEDGRFYLLARLVHLDEPSEPAPGLAQVRINNNIALRRAEVSRAPFPVGEQDTLVVRVNFPDVPGTADPNVVATRIAEADAWLQEVSYGLTTLNPLFAGPITLDNGKDFYTAPNKTLLIEMSTEVLSKLLDIDPQLFDGPTAEPEDDVDRVVIVLNDPDFTTDWATTGPWPYGLDLAWTHQIGGSAASHDRVQAVAADASGVYVAGRIAEALPGQSLEGFDDAYVRKYDRMGNEIWTHQFGSSHLDMARGIDVDDSGVYVVGTTLGSLPGQTSAGGGDAFIRKLDSSGTEVWTRQFGTGGGDWDEAHSVFVDGSGVYVAGSTATGALPGQVSAGGHDAFVRKYSHAGDEVWTRQFGTAFTDEAQGVYADTTGLYVTGGVGGDAALSGQTSIGGTDAFVRKYDPAGNEVWTRQFGTAFNDDALDVHADTTGIYVVGNVGVGGALSGQTNVGGTDAFVRKYDTSGNEVWTRQFGSDTHDNGLGIAGDATGVYVSGMTAGRLPGQVSRGGRDAFIRKYDLSGTPLWTRQFGGSSPSYERATSVAVDASGAYVAGWTGGTLPGHTNPGQYAAFVRKYAFLGQGEIRHLSVSVQGPDNTTPQYTHGLAHHFGLRDLYIHENVSFPLKQVADEWDNMAKPFEGAHPFAWSKELATWVTAGGGKIFYIPRPLHDTPPLIGEPPIELHYQSILQTDQVGAIAIGLTEGVTTFEEETQFYWVEARSPNFGNADAVVPAEGVLVYSAHQLIPQGQAPVIVSDFVPSTPGLDDAIVPLRESISPPGTGITVTVESPLPDNGGYMVQVDYDPPPLDYNVYIRQGAREWLSQDIWIDNQRDGGGYQAYDAANQLTDGPVDERPIGGEQNRIYARVHNTGPATAFDVEVQFHISAPYHTLTSGEGDFDLYKIVFIDELAPGEHRDVFVTWEPLAEGDPHNCVKVELRRLFDDNNAADNKAQQNFRVIDASQASPYDTVVFPFHVANPDPDPKLVYLRQEGVPLTWSTAISPTKQLLAPGEKLFGVLTSQPPEQAPACTDHEMEVTAWTPRGDTLIRLGGTTVDVHLRNRTGIALDFRVTQVQDCGFEEDPILDSPQQPGRCVRIFVFGQTGPERTKEEVMVRYRDPAGNPVYQTVMTDEFGRFEASYPAINGGEWEVTAFYAGDQCSGPAEETKGLEVPLEDTPDRDNDELMDEAEVQGDADADGFPNHLDSDSDNDGVLDGSEEPGDADQDGLENVIDVDSDNDGIADGEDRLPYESN